MLRRTQKLALGLFIAGFIVVSTGCTSSRLLKSKNDLNLSSAFPAPSSLEIPEAVNSHDDMSAPKKPMSPSAGGSGTKIASNSAPMGAHPQVQSGYYDVPAGSPATPMTAEPDHMYATAPATPSAPVVPVATTPVAAPLPPASQVQQVNHERSIYESEPAYTASAATHDAPLYGTSTMPSATPVATIAPATATQSIPTAPTPIATPTTAPATYTAANNGNYYQSQAAQPRPWRPGSTSDLKTL